jgi:hypothetical protein
MKNFYEVQQLHGSRWVNVGFFKSKKAAEKHTKTFNTKTVIAPVRVVKKEFIG